MINNKKLKKARNKIDKIDRDIFNNIKKRTHVIKYMLSLKMYKKQIVDHRRINEILKNKSCHFLFFPLGGAAGKRARTDFLCGLASSESARMSECQLAPA